MLGCRSTLTCRQLHQGHGHHLVCQGAGPHAATILLLLILSTASRRAKSLQHLVSLSIEHEHGRGLDNVGFIKS